MLDIILLGVILFFVGLNALSLYSPPDPNTPWVAPALLSDPGETAYTQTTISSDSSTLHASSDSPIIDDVVMDVADKQLGITDSYDDDPTQMGIQNYDDSGILNWILSFFGIGD